MTLAAGERIGPYEIVGTLGAGGMGEVYRARDTKLHREVALKMLPETLARDPERLARFRREAQVLASLNHPNIAALYGLEDSGDDHHQALVMELVPGRTLAEIVASDGAMPPDAAIAVARQIADALEAAHDAGIVHRDLKPANVKRRDDDVVKVLDFGLAKGAAEPDRADTPSSPTVLSPAVTQHGVILGTAAYMSPEQARGRVVDKRADIWAFGVVLYELLVGRPLFHGETITETIAAVIKDPIAFDALPAGTPPAVRRLLARCLDRDPKQRLRDIGEARIALSARDAAGADTEVSAEAPETTARSRVARRVAFVVGALALAAAAALASWRVKPVAPLPVRRLDLPADIGETQALALAPDGARVAYVTQGRLYARALDAREPVDLGEVSPATSVVFWSADSQSIGYDGDEVLHTISASGGVPFSVCKIPASGRLLAGAWRPDGSIVMAVWRDNLYQVADKGGAPTLLAAIDPKTEIDFHAIALLPGSQLLVATHVRGSDGTRADLVDGAHRTPATDDRDVSDMKAAPVHRVLFLRRRDNPGVWAAPFDGHTIDLSRAVMVEPGATDFDASPDGTLLSVLPARERRQIVWIDPHGGEAAAVPVPGATFQSRSSAVALSRDGRRAVFTLRLPGMRDDVVVRDLATGTDTHVPSPEPSSAAADAMVTWAPSGRLLYATGGIESSKIFDWPADGSHDGRLLVTGATARFSPDGRELLILDDERGAARLRRASIGADGSVGRVEPVFPASDEPNVRSFDMSPDGRLLAVGILDPSGSQQVDVSIMTYPDLRERRQVTSAGGSQPRFSRDGRELFFATGTRSATGLTVGRLSVVPITTAPLGIGAARTVLSAAVGNPGWGLTGYDVAPDGRLIVTRVVPPAPGDARRLVLLQNWPGAIAKER